MLVTTHRVVDWMSICVHSIQHMYLRTVNGTNKHLPNLPCCQYIKSHQVGKWLIFSCLRTWRGILHIQRRWLFKLCLNTYTYLIHTSSIFQPKTLYQYTWPSRFQSYRLRRLFVQCCLGTKNVGCFWNNEGRREFSEGRINLLEVSKCQSSSIS